MGVGVKGRKGAYVCLELTVWDSEDLAGGDVTQRPTKDDVQSHSCTAHEFVRHSPPLSSHKGDRVTHLVQRAQETARVRRRSA